MCGRCGKGKEKKWILAVLLTAALVTCSGCGQPRQEDGEAAYTEDGRIRLTLDTLYKGYDRELLRVIDAYNEQDTEYYVQLRDLSVEGVDGNTALEQWRIDMTSGKGSDIVDVSMADRRMLGAAGMLADLYDFQTKEQWQQEYIPNIVEAAETGGALYAMGPVFNLYTVVANGALVNPEGGWTMQEMMDEFAANGKGANALTGFGAGEGYTFTLSGFAMDDYIDWRGRKADFETEEFYRFLEFAREREETVNGGASHFQGIMEGEYLAGFELINSVTDYQVLREYWGENLVVKGFPTGKGRGVAAQVMSSLGIYAGSPCQEGAWDFLKYYLENYEDEACFPTRQERLEEVFAASMRSEYSGESEGEKVPKRVIYGDIDRASGSPNILSCIYEASPEDVEGMREIIGMVDREHQYNMTVQNIINEEMESCIKGDIAIEQVAHTINNRVNLYLKE